MNASLTELLELWIRVNRNRVSVRVSPTCQAGVVPNARTALLICSGEIYSGARVRNI